MSTTLFNAFLATARDLYDLYTGTTSGAGTATTLVDAALLGKVNTWITDNTHVILAEEPASAAAIYDERKVTRLEYTTGTLTTLTFAAAPGTGIDYYLTRMFSPSEYRTAIVQAATQGYPFIHKPIWDESLASGNWLKDGSIEVWTSSTDPTYWTDTTLTATRTSTAGYVRHGTYSCKLDSAAGTFKQTISLETGLQFLRGKSATFSCQAWCDTASALRLSIYDGTTTTYSDYHAGDSSWTEDNPRNDTMYVTAYIDPNATEVTATVHLVSATATAYVDDLRLISQPHSPLYIGGLGLTQNMPRAVFIEPSYYSQEEPWIRVTGWTIDPNGYLRIPTSYPVDRRLRIIGMGYLDFLASGVSSTDWTATIELSDPQLRILTAEAALYLYTQMSLPNFSSGDTERFERMIGIWQNRLSERRSQFGMPIPPMPVKRSV